MKTCYACNKSEPEYTLYEWFTADGSSEHGCHECLMSEEHKEYQKRDIENERQKFKDATFT